MTIHAVVMALAILPVGGSGAPVHGDATLKSPASSVAAGDSLTLNGEDFVPGESYKLVLRGALAEYELGTASPKPDSTFTRGLAVPRDVRTGQYKIVAVAPDGDDVATLDMVVTAMVNAAGQEDLAGEHRDQPSGEARSDDIVVERSRAGMEWGVIGLVIGLAAGLGVALLRRA